MNVNKFPYEILSAILEAAAEQNKRDGVQFTYGLSQAPIAHQQVKVQRYVRGQRKPDQLNWDATWSIRQTCSLWHHWALKYSMKNVFVKRWLGGERWVELPDRPSKLSPSPPGLPDIRSLSLTLTTVPCSSLQHL